MNLQTTRLACALALASLLPACFDELPSPPGDSDDASSSSGEDTSSSDGMTSTSAGVGTDVGGSTTDADPATTDDATTASMTDGPWEGLFACSLDEPCAPWVLPSCPGDPCPPLGEAGMCIFKQLRNRVADARLLVDECEGCDRHALVPRGSGNDAIERQVATIDGGEPTGFSDIERCVLAPDTFFDECIAAPAPPCFDMSQWVMDCEPSPAPICEP